MVAWISVWKLPNICLLNSVSFSGCLMIFATWLINFQMSFLFCMSFSSFGLLNCRQITALFSWIQYTLCWHNQIDNFHLSKANCTKETPYFPLLFSTRKTSRNCSQNFWLNQLANKATFNRYVKDNIVFW